MAAPLGRLRTLRRAAYGAASVVLIGAGVSLLSTPASAGAAPYEIESFTSRTTDEAEADYTLAGGHPFQNITDFDLSGAGEREQALKDAGVDLPTGFFGNPAAAPRCPVGLIASEPSEFPLGSVCPAGSIVGTVLFNHSGTLPLYNVKPDKGYSAQFTFRVLNSPISLDATLHPRTESYGLTVGAIDASGRIVHLAGLTTTFCGYGVTGGGPELLHCQPPSGSTAAPFLTNPVDCSDANPIWKLTTDSWEDPGLRLPNGLPDLSDPNWKTATEPALPVTGCDALTFDPSIAVQPLQESPGPVQADQPSGLAVDLDFPQNNDPTDPNTTVDASLPQTPAPKNITVKLPAGLSISPSSADGLGACSDQASDPAGDQVHYDSTKPVTCPDSSKIGTAVATSPLLALRDPSDDKRVVGPEPIPGSVYLLAPHPGDLPVGGGNQEGKFRLLIVLENADRGVNFKLPGTAVADPQTGQLTTVFTQNPQLPASHITVNLKEGPRAPLATPVTCGGFGSTSTIVPWSTPGTPDAHPSASFNVGSGANGSACPANAAARPFAPAMSAGTASNQAGASTPFNLHLARADGEGELSALEATLPKGLAAKFIGVPYCSEAALAAAATKSGTAEQASSSCPAASRIGAVTVGSGPGSNPFYAHGNAYLSGPYKGAPMSVSVITPAVAGPFDLGTVVSRNALFIDPETAQGHVVSDPLPTILDGVPLRLRSIDVNLDRPDFTLNPTNCTPMSVQATLHSTDGATSNTNSYFQVGGCDKLGFAPKLALKLKGGTKRNKNPALTATLTYPKGNYANIAAAQVTLPHSEFLDQSNIRTVCTRVQFAAHACPPGSVYGYAKAITPLFDKPLEGPVYLRSSNNPLPDLVADLNGQVNVVLVGKVDTGKENGLRNTFQLVPDAPVTKFTLSLQGGKKKGLLVNSENLCNPNAKTKAIADFTAQNGKTYNTKPTVTNSCKKGGKGKKPKSGAKAKNKANPHNRLAAAWLPPLGF